MQPREQNQSRPTLTSLTRRKIVESLENVKWSGALDEVAFLSRLHDLQELPSTDSRHRDADGDIRRHRFANDDWPDNWVFHDDRFGLQQGDDEPLLRFLAAMLHPDIREVDEAKQLAVELNSHLSRDGWELYPIAAVSGYPTYGWRTRPPSTIGTPSGFPTDAEQLVASVAELLRHRGRDRELAVLANSEFSITKSSHDNWDGGITGWSVSCACDAGLYARLTEAEHDDTETYIDRACTEVLRQFPRHRIDRVLIAPRSTNRATWRAQTTRWLSGEGVNNQGRVRSDSVASLECDGLLFRSEEEIHLYRALKRVGVTFAPLPVFIRGGQQYSRLEPDFVIIKDGHVMVVEVDGDLYHKESPAEAHQRLQPLDHEGAKVERVRAADCETPEKAQKTVEKLLKVLDAMARRR
jgi:AbiJ N-terminal domain 3